LSASEDGPLVVYAPGSIVPVQDALRAAFAVVDPGVEVFFHPPTHSGLLARQILSGADADVFVSAGWRYVVELHDAGLLPQPEVVAGNRLAILVRPELATEVRSVRDLVRPRLRLLVPPPASDPLGQYTVELFDRAGLAEAIAAKRARGEISEELGGLRDTLAARGIDAVILYSSMLAAFADAGTAIPLPALDDMNDRIVFGAGAVMRDGTMHPAAARFVAFLVGPVGQDVLTQAGFLPRSHASRTLPTAG
jgi:molybdate transport system substrate-binding protein